MTRRDEIPGIDPDHNAMPVAPAKDIITGEIRGSCETITGLRVLGDEPIFKGESGAVCTQVDGRYDLICPTGLRRLAQRYGLGAEHYGDYNWCKAGKDKKFQRERLNHLVKHITHYLLHGDDGSDDDLAAIAWNAFALMHYSENCTCHEMKIGRSE